MNSNFVTEDFSQRRTPYLSRFLQVSHNAQIHFDHLNGPFLAGGSIRRLYDLYLGNEVPGKFDFDIFFKDSMQYEEAYYKLFSVGADLVSDTRLKADFLKEGFNFQLVRRGWFKNSEEVIKDFDITICCFAIDDSWQVLATHRAVHDLMMRRLEIDHMDDPLATFVRLMKYHRQGFNIGQTSLVDFMVQSESLITPELIKKWEMIFQLTGEI